MDLRGTIDTLYRDFKDNKWHLVLNLVHPPSDSEYNNLANVDDLDISIKKHREKRSLNANALLWKCLGEMAVALNADKWDIYLAMLKKYGKYTYICVKPNVVEAMKKQWRECEVIGDININGAKAVQMLCYFGSSTYDTKEFSTLLEGVMYEMAQMGLALPIPEQLEKALMEWERTQK